MGELKKRRTATGKRHLGKTNLGKILFNRTELRNGIRIVSEYIPLVESFSLGIFIDAGSREDPENLSGVAHFLEHLSFRSSRHGTSRQVSSKFEAVGAYTNAYTTKEYTCYHVRALKGHFKRSLSLLTDIVFGLDFSSNDVDAERNVIIEEIKFYNDDTEEVLFEKGESLVFNGHGLGRPITGTEESVCYISMEDIREFYGRYYNSDNIIIAVAGNIEHERVVRNADKLLGGIPRSGENTKRIPPNNFSSESSDMTGNALQSSFLAGRRIPGVGSDDKYPLLALNELFCGGMSSRLQNKVRDRYGLAYNIDSELFFYNDCGSYHIFATLEQENLQKVSDIIFDEMKAIRKKISFAELQRAKEQLKSGIIMDSESMSSRMQKIAKEELAGTEREPLGARLVAIDEIMPGDVLGVAAKYFDPADWSTVRINPSKRRSP